MFHRKRRRTDPVQPEPQPQKGSPLSDVDIADFLMTAAAGPSPRELRHRAVVAATVEARNAALAGLRCRDGTARQRQLLARALDACEEILVTIKGTGLDVAIPAPS